MAHLEPERGPLGIKWAKNDKFSVSGVAHWTSIAYFTPVARAPAAPLCRCQAEAEAIKCQVDDGPEVAHHAVTAISQTGAPGHRRWTASGSP